MAAMFKFEQPIDKNDVVKAIFDVAKKDWGKASAQAQKEGKAFEQPEPKLETFQAEYKDMNSEAVLMSAASKGRISRIPETTESLSKDEAKSLGAILLQVEKTREAKGQKHFELLTTGSDGKTYQLESKELSAWLQSNAGGTPMAADTWAAKNKVGLTAHGDLKPNGPDEMIYVETREGEKRVVGNGMLSEPIKDGVYGGIKTKNDAGQTQSLAVGDGDDLDVYIRKEVFEKMEAGKAYDGPVFVMQQMDKGKTDELKLGFAGDIREFRNMMTSTWGDKAGDFAKNNEGAYAQLTQEQYKQLKAEITKNPNLTLEEFAKGKDIKMITPEQARDETMKLNALSAVKGYNQSMQQMAASGAAVGANMANADNELKASPLANMGRQSGSMDGPGFI
jgi:hypothetical protein